MNKHRRSCRKRSADHLGSQHVEKKTKNSNSSGYHSNLARQQNNIRVSGYKYCNILPDVNELHSEPGDELHAISPNVRPHIVKGGYNSWQHYLSTQFYLLQEDFVAPLRKGICNYKNHGETSDIKVYQRTIFTEMVLNENGILLSVELKAPQNNILSHNLINGKLLCFSTENFESVIFATVINQNNRSLDNHVIQVKMELDRDELSMLGLNKNNFTSSQEYTMIETSGHYESYYHFLKSLQHVDPNRMPFTDYLINFKYHKMRHPRYLTNGSVFEMGSVLQFEDTLHSSCFDIMNDSLWPTHHEVKRLDQSQIKALQMALTHKVALIQGPPGTGKTMIGKKIVEALVINKAKWDHLSPSPILVVCYTNHALDQFLEKLIKMKKDFESSEKSSPLCKIVRIGGGCTSEKVEECSIKHLNSKGTQETNQRNAKKQSSRITNLYFSLKRKLSKLSKEIKEQMELLVYNNQPSIEDLSTYIAPVHFDQLIISSDSCIEVWLTGYSYHQNGCTRSKGKQISLGKNLLTAPDDCLGKPATGHVLHQSDQENSSDFAVIKMPNFPHTDQQIAYTADEVESLDDINILLPNERKKLYNYWIRRYHDNIYNNICELIDQFNKIHTKFIEAQKEKDAELLQEATIIGMTNTGAAKYRHLLEKLKPKIVIVEEAAEVMEPHIIPCLTAATEHLILIGDHKQLQPKPNEYHLARKYNLNVSLFERLILNHVPHVTLTVQHRMRPEIARLISPHIYSELHDHESVTEYENIRGINTNLYFFNHKYKEAKTVNSHSYCNEREADLVAGLCNYLLKQDYKPSDITILAAYASQVTHLKKLIPAAVGDKQHSQTKETSKDEIEQTVTITTVDNYQGEENDIIILSLVRSNDDDNQGFLEIENRVCVALSRARKGLYCFGNFDLLRRSKKSDVWQKILGDLKNKNQVGSAIQLHCTNHPKSLTTITQPGDFQKVSEGGCWLQCNALLACGHKCTLKCHIKDAQHKHYVCKEPCLKKCESCAEPCKLKCCMDCQRCEKLIEKSIPGCNHTQLVPCYMGPEEFKCKAKCNKVCSRGHPCTLMCSDVCKCMWAKTTTLLCGHKATSYCFENYIVADCSAPCNKACTTNGKNPHRCLKRCSDDCGNCETLVEAVLPWCNHKCKIPCYMQQDLIFLASVNCTALVEAILPTYGETTEISDYYCRVPVTVNLPCGHSKAIECYKTQDKCIVAAEKCFVKVSKYFQKCKHVVELPCHNSQLTECPAKCDTVLLCGHKCSGTCHECHQGRLHKPCMFHVSKLLCGHVTTMKCSSTMIEPYPSCSYRCERFCSHKKCSHKCEQPCKPCHKPCDWRCTHFKCTRKCHENCNRPRCYEPCPRLNKCRHPCIGVCGERCPDVCKICDEEQFLQLRVFINQFRAKNNTSYIQLDCGHLFKRTELDPWVDAQSKQFQLISCPKCHQPIHLNQRRYANAIRRTYEAMVTRRHKINTRVDTNVKLEALKRYYATIKTATKLFGLSDLTTFEGVRYEELEEFDVASDRELERFALACCNKNDTKFCQGIKKFIENKKENWLSTINVIVNIFDSILCLFKLPHSNIAITNCLEMLGRFILANHKSLSLQMIQDVTREHNRLAIWLMTIQLKNKTLNHLDLQIVAQVENVISPEKLYNYKSLLPQQAERLHRKLSPLAKNYGIDGKFISTTPTLPLVYTGKWRLCNEGHYYCIPEVSCDFLTSSQQCPQCSEEDDNDIIEY